MPADGNLLHDEKAAARRASISGPIPVARVTEAQFGAGKDFFCGAAVAFGVLCLACTSRLDPTLSLGGTDTAEPDGGCSSLKSSTSQYSVCPALLSFDAAEIDCEAQGGVLAQISSSGENSLLVLASNELGMPTNFWIGGSRNDEHVWSWRDGTTFWTGLAAGSAPDGIYANWKAGEPNNSSTVVDEPERCAALTLFDTQWNDRACSLELGYICERDLSAPAP